MAKFKMRLKLTGLELDLEGERSDIPKMAANAAEQLRGLFEPAARVAADREPPGLFDKQAAAASDGNGTKDGGPSKGKKGGNRRFVRSREVTAAATAVDFPHAPDSWGNPKQGWSIRQKVLWLLYVAAQTGAITEMPAAVIVATFNKHFRQAGELRTNLANRELGRAKSVSPPLLGEDTTKEPSAWYLTDAGKTAAIALVNEAKGGNAGAGADGG